MFVKIDCFWINGLFYTLLRINWSTSSGGSSGASFPIDGDDVIFDSDSANANITINVVSACSTLTCSSYTGNITFTSTLTTTGNLVFSTGMTTTGPGSLNVSNTIFSITSNGVQLRNFVLLNGSATITLNDDIYVENLTKTGASGTGTFDGFNLKVNGNILINNNTFISGTSNLILVGNTTFSGAGRPKINITINTLGTITFSSSFWFDGPDKILTYITGTVIPPSSLSISSGTFNTNGIIWNTILPVLCNINY